MIYDYFSLAPSAKLKLKKKRVSEARITKRTLKVEAAARVKRFEEVMKIKDIVREELNDCVDTVCEMVPSRLGRRIGHVENKEELEEVVMPPSQELLGKRKRV